MSLNELNDVGNFRSAPYDGVVKATAVNFKRYLLCLLLNHRMTQFYVFSHFFSLSILTHFRAIFILPIIEPPNDSILSCALRALGLLLADGTPTVGGGKTF